VSSPPAEPGSSGTADVVRGGAAPQAHRANSAAAAAAQLHTRVLVCVCAHVRLAAAAAAVLAAVVVAHHAHSVAMVAITISGAEEPKARKEAPAASSGMS
jgi:hypothetical protein